MTSLTTTDHDRASAGLKYVYAVLSRRSGGLSIGINLNPNRACNWRCIYCQVPGLVRGVAPPIDLGLLEEELGGFLEEVVRGDRYAGVTIEDIAFSGDGESTTSDVFDAAVDVVAGVAERFEAARLAQLILITNGSLLRRPHVLRGLETMARMNGEVWFKLDAGSVSGREEINDAHFSQEHLLGNLSAAADLCTVRLHTCVFTLDGSPPDTAARSAYIELLQAIKDRPVDVAGVTVYGIERPSHQPEAERLGKVPQAWMDEFAGQIRPLGFEVRIHP